MNQLDEPTRRALSAADQPPPGVEDRILAAILAPIGAVTDAAAGSAAGSGAGGGSIGFAAKIVAVTLGLTVGGVGALALVGAGVRAAKQPTARDPIAAVDADASAAVVEPELIGSSEPRLESAATTTTTFSISGDRVIQTGPRPSKLGRAAPRMASDPAPSDTSVEAELALMQRARAAKPNAALALLEQHRERFEAGVFAAERDVLRFERLCALGRANEAEAVAAAFIAAYPTDPLRSRVSSTCD